MWKNQTKCITDKQNVFLCLIYACNWLAHGSYWHGRLDLPRLKPAQSWRRNCFRASCSVLAFMSMPKVKISQLYAVALKITLHESISLCSSWSVHDTLAFQMTWTTRDICQSLCHAHEMLVNPCVMDTRCLSFPVSWTTRDASTPVSLTW